MAGLDMVSVSQQPLRVHAVGVDVL